MIVKCFQACPKCPRQVLIIFLFVRFSLCKTAQIKRTRNGIFSALVFKMTVGSITCGRLTLNVYKIIIMIKYFGILLLFRSFFKDFFAILTQNLLVPYKIQKIVKHFERWKTFLSRFQDPFLSIIVKL